MYQHHDGKLQLQSKLPNLLLNGHFGITESICRRSSAMRTGAAQNRTKVASNLCNKRSPSRFDDTRACNCSSLTSQVHPRRTHQASLANITGLSSPCAFGLGMDKVLALQFSSIASTKFLYHFCNGIILQRALQMRAR